MIRLVWVMAFVLASAHMCLAFTGTVVRISDGDTIVVQGATGAPVKVRLYGVDTPESKQVFGSQASRFTAQQVLHKDVRIDKRDVDRYGRVVAIVYAENGEILNEKLVENGHAWVYEKYCDIDECNAWKEKQDAAMANKKGLWQDPDPIAPWDYRKSKRN